MRYSYLALLLCLPSCRPAPPIARVEPVDRLLGLMQRRLEVMHDVARWKWPDRSSIEDKVREAHILDHLARRGAALKLDPDLCRAFFGAQIESAKRVQRADFHRWETTEAPGPQSTSSDLVSVLRPRIDALNSDLLAALAEVDQLPADVEIRKRADAILNGVDAETRAVLIRPLLTRPSPSSP